MEWQFGKYLVNTDKEQLSVDKICAFFATSYWAAERSRETVLKSIEHSICFGVYDEGQQVGFARAVSDFSVMYWLCDVIIDEKYRGQGLGKFLVQCIMDYEEFKGLKGLLGTKDAHGLYQQFGFIQVPPGLIMGKA